MTELDKKHHTSIWSFIHDNTVVNISTAKNNESYAASCFYAFDEVNKLIVFKSSKDSRHIEEGLAQTVIAGTILPDKLKKAVVVGIQFQGELSHEDDGFTKSKTHYYKKYPFALGMDGDIYIIKLKYIKYTDNKLGFGKKVIWEDS